jgi:rare lipoprotein A
MRFGPALPTSRQASCLAWLALLLFLALISAGCGKKKTEAKLPPPPPIAASTAPKPAEPIPTSPPVPLPKLPAETWTQTGIASWYVAEPGGRRTASGEPYDPVALTAAHRTLPFHSLVRVTNLKTKGQVIVRINDRGPFIDGRVIDLSVAAAKAADVYRSGVANVKLEVMHTPASIEFGGRWCVQIGAFRQHTSALDLKHTLTARYHQTRVLDFPGATGYWVRVRVQDDDRLLAQKVASNIKVSEGGVFLVRLD